MQPTHICQVQEPPGRAHSFLFKLRGVWCTYHLRLRWVSFCTTPFRELHQNRPLVKSFVLTLTVNTIMSHTNFYSPWKTMAFVSESCWQGQSNIPHLHALLIVQQEVWRPSPTEPIDARNLFPSLSALNSEPFRDMCILFAQSQAMKIRLLLTWNELSVSWMNSRIRLGSPWTWSSVMKEKRISWTPSKGMRSRVDFANL